VPGPAQPAAALGLALGHQQRGRVQTAGARALQQLRVGGVGLGQHLHLGARPHAAQRRLQGGHAPGRVGGGTAGLVHDDALRLRTTR
jgi:hypothetical protein